MKFCLALSRNHFHPTDLSVKRIPLVGVVTFEFSMLLLCQIEIILRPFEDVHVVKGHITEVFIGNYPKTVWDIGTFHMIFTSHIAEDQIRIPNGISFLSQKSVHFSSIFSFKMPVRKSPIMPNSCVRYLNNEGPRRFTEFNVKNRQ